MYDKTFTLYSPAAPAHLSSIHQQLVNDHKERIFLIRVQYYISLLIIQQMGINLPLKWDK